MPKNFRSYKAQAKEPTMTNYKKIALATLSYVVLSMLIAFPWHMIWFHDLYEKMGAVTRAEPIVPLGMLSMLIQGAVIAYLYPFWYKGGHPVFQGIKFSFIAGLLIYTVMGFATAAKMNIEPVSTFLIYHTAFQAIQFTLTGAALGLIYGRKATTRKS
jgi:hypothetical protein